MVKVPGPPESQPPPYRAPLSRRPTLSYYLYRKAKYRIPLVVVPLTARDRNKSVSVSVETRRSDDLYTGASPDGDGVEEAERGGLCWAEMVKGGRWGEAD